MTSRLAASGPSRRRTAAPWLLAAALLGLAGCNRSSESPAAVSGVGASAVALAQRKPLVARFVKFVEATEWNGKDWAAVAEFNLLDASGAPLDRRGWKATADSVETPDSASYAIDGDPKTMWHTRWEGDTPPPPPHQLTLDLGKPAHLTGFKLLPRQDGTVNGTPAKYRLYLSDDGVHWDVLAAEGDFFQSGGPKDEKTVVFAEQSPNHPPQLTAPAAQTARVGQTVTLQVHATDADGDAIVFGATGLPPGLQMAAATGAITGTPIGTGTYPVTLTAADGKAPAMTATFQWQVEAPASAAGTPLPAGEVRFVKLEEVSEVNGKPWGSIAEFNLIGPDGMNLPRSGWKAIADSADTSDKPQNAIDDNPASIWHSQWDGAAPPPPHSFIVDLGKAAQVRGFRYLPRQDSPTNGMIARFRFFTSADGVDWGKPVAEGDFSAMGAPRTEKTVMTP